MAVAINVAVILCWRGPSYPVDALHVPDEYRHQAPRWHSICFASVRGRLAGLVVNLPGKRSALVPAHSLRPNEDGFALGVARHDRMLPATSRVRCLNRLGSLARLRVNVGVVHLPLSLPGREDATSTLGEGGRAHGATADLPWADI